MFSKYKSTYVSLYWFKKKFLFIKISPILRNFHAIRDTETTCSFFDKNTETTCSNPLSLFFFFFLSIFYCAGDNSLFGQASTIVTFILFTYIRIIKFSTLQQPQQKTSVDRSRETRSNQGASVLQTRTSLYNLHF